MLLIFASTFSFIVYADSGLLNTIDITSDFQKKKIFEFDLATEMVSQEIGPGDSFNASPVITNNATEDMYVFIEVNMPDCNGEHLYSFDAGEEWTLVDEGYDHLVYAYGSDELTILHPGEQTSVLTETIAMKEISVAEYSYIDDINITIRGIGIDTSGM